jgi:hypothetical protein
MFFRRSLITSPRNSSNTLYISGLYPVQLHVCVSVSLTLSCTDKNIFYGGNVNNFADLWLTKVEAMLIVYRCFVVPAMFISHFIEML